MASNLYSLCNPIVINTCKLYQDNAATTPAIDGFYSDGTTCYQVSGGAGVVTAITVCPPSSHQFFLNSGTTCTLACNSIVPLPPTTLTGFNQPIYMATDNEGTVYVFNYGNYSISKITQKGVVTHNWGFTNTTNNGTQMVCDTLGNLYTVDGKVNTSNGTITKFSKSGVRTLNWSGPCYYALTLAIDNNNILYTCGAAVKTAISTINTSGVVTLRVPQNTMQTAGTWILGYNAFKNRVSILGDYAQYNLSTVSYALDSNVNNLYSDYSRRMASNGIGLVASVHQADLTLNGENINTPFQIDISSLDYSESVDVAKNGTTLYLLGSIGNVGYVYKVVPPYTDIGPAVYTCQTGSSDIILNNFGNVFVCNSGSNTVSVFLE